MRLHAILATGLSLLLGCSDQRDSRLCAACTVEYEEGTTLDSEAGIDWDTRVAIMPDYTLLAAPVQGVGSGALALLDSTGALIRTVGRKGSGPGEFNNIRRVAVDSAGTVYVADSKRVTMLDGALAYTREIPLQRMAYDMEIVRPGVVALCFARVSAPQREPPIAIIDSTGVAAATFGTDNSAVYLSSYRHLAVAGSMVTSVRELQGLVELYTIGGEPRGSVRISHDWFGDEPRPDAVPETRIADAAVMEDGHLWVLVYRQRAAWKPAATADGGEAAPRRLGIDEMADRYEQRIEIVDLKAKAIIAKVDVRDRLLTGFVGGTSVLGFTQPYDAQVAVLWRVRLTNGTDNTGGNSVTSDR